MESVIIGYVRISWSDIRFWMVLRKSNVWLMDKMEYYADEKEEIKIHRNSYDK